MTSMIDKTLLALLQFVSSTRRVAGLYIANFIFCTLVFMAAERQNLFDSLWWCTVTWFTVGYGDFVPKSFEGRLFTMYAIISSHILIVLITANFVIKLSRFRDHRHAKKHLFCDIHRQHLVESFECKDCNIPLLPY